MEIKLKKRYKYAGDVYAELLKNAFTPSYASELLDKVPDADVAPVVHGKWVEGFKKVKDWRGSEYDLWFPMMCNVCGMDVPVGSKYKFCPYCGTTMLEVSK